MKMEINKEENKITEERMLKALHTEYKCFTVEEFKSIRRDLDRLEQYKTIEEEIGLDLTVVFSALKNGVWYFDEQGQLVHDYVWLVNNYVAAGVPDKLSFSFKTFISGKILLFAGYGKEWALTEERLHENCIINFYDICSYN